MLSVENPVGVLYDSRTILVLVWERPRSLFIREINIDTRWRKEKKLCTTIDVRIILSEGFSWIGYRWLVWETSAIKEFIHRRDDLMVRNRLFCYSQIHISFHLKCDTNINDLKSVWSSMAKFISNAWRPLPVTLTDFIFVSQTDVWFQNANQSKIISSNVLERQTIEHPFVPSIVNAPLANVNTTQEEEFQSLDTWLWYECWTIHLAFSEISPCPSESDRLESAMDTIVQCIDCRWSCSEEYRWSPSGRHPVHWSAWVCVVLFLDRFCIAR